MNAERHLVITPRFRVSFPQVFVPRSFQDNPNLGKSFSLDMIFDSKDDFKKAYNGKKAKTGSMMQAVVNAKKDQWGPDKEQWPRMEYPVFKDGNDRLSKDGEVFDGYADKWFVTARCGEKFAPKILSKAGKPLTENDFYGGCYAQAQLMARPYAFGKNFGVRFLLLSVMKLEDGERFGGGGNNPLFDVVEDDEESDFDEYSDDDGDSDDGDDF
jgi:hypothetical protein